MTKWMITYVRNMCIPVVADADPENHCAVHVEADSTTVVIECTAANLPYPHYRVVADKISYIPSYESYLGISEKRRSYGS